MNRVVRDASAQVPEALIGDVRVVDDFYPDPQAVRAFALAAEFQSFGDAANFPGSESVKAFYTPKHVARFEQLVGTSIVCDPRRWVFGKFRLAVRADEGRTSVHMDKVDWTAVVYLSRNVDSEGGLGFYRHRSTGLDRIPVRDQLASFGCRDLHDFDRRFVVPASTDATQWERIGFVPLRFNRLVLFRGTRVFHGITATFGERAENARLTQNFFFMERRRDDGD
jgi:hypothetical protein